MIFADAGFWIAMWDPDDALNTRAMALSTELMGETYVTTQMVLTEAINYMSGHGEYLRRMSVERVRQLQNSPAVEVVPQTDALFQTALERYDSRADQRWSLTDCASFLVMEERQITQALAYDRDFEQAGFVALLRDR